MVRDEELDFWIQNEYNVLFMGHAGVGKTSLIKAAFNRNNLNWKYFSASTMDPWVDLIGVPKEKKDENGNSYLDLVRPREFQNDEIQAIFFDEYNRSHKKIRNACMELIQFKSINGKKFNNLKIVWAAINPDDDEYDVEKLDPAQKDRFPVRVQIPYKPTKSYFSKKYGETTAKAAISWWDGLSQEIKMEVSPRRLDYALDMLDKKGDIRYVLPESSNITKLLTTLKHGPISEALQKLLDKNDHVAAKIFLAVENNYAASLDWIIKKKERMEFFLENFPLEKLSSLIATNDIALQIALNKIGSNDQYKEVISKILTLGSNSKIIQKVKKTAKTNAALATALGIVEKSKISTINLGTHIENPYYFVSVNPTYENDISTFLDYFRQNPYNSTSDRKRIYTNLQKIVPKDITVSAALKTLELLNHIAVHSQGLTLNKLVNFMGIVNQCILTLGTDPKTSSWETIVKAYKNKHFGHLYMKITKNILLGSKLLLPGNQIPIAKAV